ncbi:hypothetical protein [Propionibacterium freudenreichii]|uniref:hypothetical protein n=1 Tax=Propionibacterium freudenreichii TaxID=1744 RepID=UPI00254E228D|nr:hypothetical protein [Propionibacterium freudenreichii]
MGGKPGPARFAGVPKEVAGDNRRPALWAHRPGRGAVRRARATRWRASCTEAFPATWRHRAAEGFNTSLHDIAHAHGALLIQDEVLTGFRLSPTGAWGLQGAKEG